MAHKEQFDFCRKIKAKFPQYFKNKIVVDIGCLDINGNNNYLFDNCLYMGVDVGVGKNVDFVSKGHEFLLPDESVDVIISTECFEHDMYYDKTLKNIYRMLKPGGFLIFSCATTGRPEHGTRRTTPKDAPLLIDEGNWSDYYKNLTPLDIQAVFDLESCFSDYFFNISTTHYDLYFYGIKSGALFERDNYSFLIVGDKSANNHKHYSQLFVGNAAGKFCESNSVKISNRIAHTFDLHDLDFEDGAKLRFDPSNNGCVVSNFECCLIDESGVEHQCAILKCNANLIKDGKYYFETKDSQFYLNVPINNPRFFKYSFDIESLEDSAYYQAYVEFNKYLD